MPRKSGRTNDHKYVNQILKLAWPISTQDTRTYLFMNIKKKKKKTRRRMEEAEEANVEKATPPTKKRT
jgi:hypothetical protein